MGNHELEEAYREAHGILAESFWLPFTTTSLWISVSHIVFEKVGGRAMYSLLCSPEGVKMSTNVYTSNYIPFALLVPYCC